MQEGLTNIVRGLRVGLRSVASLLVGSWGIVVATILFLTSPVPVVRDALVGPLSRSWFRLLQMAFGVHVTEVGAPANGSALIAANHVSWMDIVVLGSRVGACFVSKSEVADWPIMGWLAKQGGTLFIQRGHRDSAERIAHAMADRLTTGGRLLFFPEGTTSDGWGVMRFKHRLFVPAVETGTPVQPVTVCYELEKGSDPVAYIDGIGFFESVIGVAARARTDVTVYWDDPIAIDGNDRREVAALAGSRVAERMAAHRRHELNDGSESHLH